jgi:serine/threonine protein kinase
MLQVSVALHYLHQQHLIHRDIKPENIFIDENDNAIVGDLGLISNRFMAGTVAGDYKYMAREVVKS